MFDHTDLERLDALLSRAERVVPMRDIHMGDRNPRVIGMRHDVDAVSDRALDAFETALQMARWEFDRGYSSTYYLLHSSHYWNADNLVRALEFEELGHEVGIHINAIAEGLRHRRSPDWILCEALVDIRSVGLRVDGGVAHGDHLCHRARFVNDEMFCESPRPSWGDPFRIVQWKGTEVPLEPKPIGDYHLKYLATHLPRGDYLSDSGGTWSDGLGGNFADVIERWPEMGQLHVLQHSDWWSAAFETQRVAA